MDRDLVLGNAARVKVYEMVIRRPGCTVLEIAESVGISPPTVRYHLDVLAREDLVMHLDRGNRLMFFRNRRDFSERERELVALLRSPEVLRVYREVEANPWVMRGELGERLGVSRASVNWHLRQLMASRLVGEAREQGRSFLFATREGRAALASVEARLAPAPAA